MALTRKFLKAMGIDDDKVDQIIDAHIEPLDSAKEEAEKYKQKAADYDRLVTEYDKLKDELKQAQETAQGDPYKSRYEAASRNCMKLLSGRYGRYDKTALSGEVFRVIFAPKMQFLGAIFAVSARNFGLHLTLENQRNPHNKAKCGCYADF